MFALLDCELVEGRLGSDGWRERIDERRRISFGSEPGVVRRSQFAVRSSQFAVRSSQFAVQLNAGADPCRQRDARERGNADDVGVPRL